MRKLVIIILLISSLLAVAACAKKANPTAKAFFMALESKDYKAAEKLGTEKSQRYIRSVADMYNNMSQGQKRNYDKLKYTVTKVEEDGDSATVTYDEWRIGSPETKRSRTTSMVKEEGKWKVDYYKEDGL
jgi:hypothetical protein